jgi:uncharacterized metal-binding protein YceD (DUF177 family)
MSKMKTYTIPHIGLPKEVQTFEYNLDKEFFSQYEHALIQDGDIAVIVRLDNRFEPYTLDFFVSGTVPAECDKCAAELRLQLEATYRVYVKFDEDPDSLKDDGLEVLFMGRDEPEIDLEPYLYDFVSLAVPMLKVCDNPGNTPYCDKEVVKLLNGEQIEEQPKIDPRWEGLNQLKDLK